MGRGKRGRSGNREELGIKERAKHTTTGYLLPS